MKKYTEDFKIIYDTNFRDRSLSGVGLYKNIPIEFNLIDEYIIKKDRYYYDRYELRYLFTTKKIIIDIKMYDEEIQENTFGYDMWLELINN